MYFLKSIPIHVLNLKNQQNIQLQPFKSVLHVSQQRLSKFDLYALSIFFIEITTVHRGIELFVN